MGSQIRSIVLTDVHLGASNSILTQVAPGRTVADTHHPSPALLSLADCLRTLVAGCNGSGRPATFIAGGLGVVNTGGWVVDHHEPRPLVGGGVALIDDDLNVALVRMYQQIDDPAAWRIAVETAGGRGEEFAGRLRGLIEADAAPWSTFTAAAAELVVERRRQIAMTLEEELRQLDT